jgi:hypothetical protein
MMSESILVLCNVAKSCDVCCVSPSAWADIGGQDLKAWTALQDENNHGILRLLPRQLGDVTLALKTGDAVLHRVAEKGDVATMEILSKACIWGADVGAMNRDGCTARGMCEKCDYVVRGPEAVFEELEMSRLSEVDEVAGWVPKKRARDRMRMRDRVG